MASRVLRVTAAVAKTLTNTPKQAPAVSSSSISKRWQTSVSYSQALSEVDDTTVSLLDNGIRVASEHIACPTATVGLWVSSGARYENATNNGVAHFLEHLAFKGTAKRSQVELEKEIESMGGQLNAYTSREQTVYYAKCFSKDMPKAVEILSDVIQNSTLNEVDIDKERKVILSELEEVDTNMQQVVMDYLHATAFMETPLAKNVYGPSENVRSFNRNDIKQYLANQYKAPRMVLAGAGGILQDDLVKAAQDHLGAVSATYENELPNRGACRFTGSEIRMRDDDLPLAHIAIAVEGCGFNNPDNIALEVANAAMGSWDRTHAGGVNLSSRLAHIAATDNLAHSFQNFNINYSDTGLWGTYFVCDPLEVEDFLFNVQKEWMRFCFSVTEFEIERAKDLLKTTIFMNLDGTTPICEDIGRQVLFQGRRVPLAELDAQISAVNAKTVHNVCMKYFYDQCPAVAAVGPVEQLPDYSRIRASNYWLRT